MSLGFCCSPFTAVGDQYKVLTARVPDPECPSPGSTARPRLGGSAAGTPGRAPFTPRGAEPCLPTKSTHRARSQSARRPLPSWPVAAPFLLMLKQRLRVARGLRQPGGKASGDPSAPSPAPGPAATRGVGVHSPEPGAVGAPQGHTARTSALPANAHRLLPRAVPSGGGCGMRLGVALGGPERSTAAAVPAPLWRCLGTRAPFPPAPNVAARRSGPQRRSGCPPALPESSAQATFLSPEPGAGARSFLVFPSSQRPCSPPASLLPAPQRPCPFLQHPCGPQQCLCAPLSALCPLESICSTPAPLPSNPSTFP